MSDEKPIYGTFDLPIPLKASRLAQAYMLARLDETSLEKVRAIVHEELIAIRQHQHKTGMRRFTFPWGDSHVEGVVFSHASHPGLVAYVNGGIYDFCGSIHVMCAKLNILEADIVWIDEITV